MKTASVTDAKNNLSALIANLRGGPVLILDRGRPVARLEAPLVDEQGQSGWDALVRGGVITPPRRRLPAKLWTEPLPKLPSRVSMTRILLEERREGR